MRGATLRPYFEMLDLAGKACQDLHYSLFYVLYCVKENKFYIIGFNVIKCFFSVTDVEANKLDCFFSRQAILV